MLPQLRSVAVLAVGLVLVVGCSGSNTSTTGSTSSGSAASSTSAPSTAASPTSAGRGATGGGPNVGGGGGQSTTINMTDAYQYQPATVTVPRGSTVTWVATGQQPHTVTDDPSKASKASDAMLPSGAQPWDSGMINAGQNFSKTIDTPGDYTYFCIPHEALGMVAHITVSP